MIASKQFQDGFTAVELLIALIIASMFLFSGYQLYSQVTRDGAEANKTASLSNRVVEKTRERATSSNLTCTSTFANETVNEPGIGNVQYVTAVSCPNTELQSLKLIRVTATIVNTNEVVQYATYSK